MQPTTYLTLEQYLEIERGAEFRSEYIDGEMFAIAGGTPNHAWIIANTLSQLAQQLRGHRCGARSSDLRLYSAKQKSVTYPDIIVTCGPDQLLDARRDTLLLAQDEMRAEHHVRQADGTCLLREFAGPEDEIDLKSIGYRLTLQSLYERVEFEATA